MNETKQQRPLNCACGLRANKEHNDANGSDARFWIECSSINCWRGPVRLSVAEAIGSWNLAMSMVPRKSNRKPAWPATVAV